MRTYTLFLPDITEDDLMPDGDEFSEIDEYEDYISKQNSLRNTLDYDYDSSDASQSDDSISDSDDSYDDDNDDNSDNDDNNDDGIPDKFESTYESLFLKDASQIPDIPDDVDLTDIPEDLMCIADIDMSGVSMSMNMSVQQYDDVPEYYVGRSTWMKSTNNLCIMCSNKIQGVPMFIPISWHRRVVQPDVQADDDDLYLNPVHVNKTIEQKALKIHKRVLTCNERCSKRYIVCVRDDEITDKWQSLQLLRWLVKDMKGYDPGEIREALDKSIMEQYCGPTKGISSQKFNELNMQK